MGKKLTRTGQVRRVGVVAALVLAFVGAGALYWYDQHATPSDYAQMGPLQDRVTVQVAPGQSLRAIAAALADAGVIAGQGAFVEAATSTPAAKAVQPGSYRLSRHLPAATALQALLGQGPAGLPMVDVPAQAKVKDVLAKLAAATSLSEQDLAAAAADPSLLGLDSQARGHLEGWLGPGRYDVAPEDSAASVLARMVAAQRAVVAAAALDGSASRTRHSVADLVVIASIVQAEAIPDDYAKVAAVIDNRLAAGMKLQMDSTVNYGLHTSSMKFSGDQLASESPYNTYRIDALPPSAIATPSAAALKAAADPAAGDWLYFVLASKDGHSEFSFSYAQHQDAVARAHAAGLF